MTVYQAWTMLVMDTAEIDVISYLGYHLYFRREVNNKLEKFQYDTKLSSVANNSKCSNNSNLEQWKTWA